mmetsp:Transcript_34716/g.103009  ORF Transcript_34716/g.103009 Transcript_34716/m.103009 type:complete len:259 (-) Transcript_34716:187-963(-)
MLQVPWSTSRGMRLNGGMTSHHTSSASRPVMLPLATPPARARSAPALVPLVPAGAPSLHVSSVVNFMQNFWSSCILSMSSDPRMEQLSALRTTRAGLRSVVTLISTAGSSHTSRIWTRGTVSAKRLPSIHRICCGSSTKYCSTGSVIYLDRLTSPPWSSTCTVDTPVAPIFAGSLSCSGCRGMRRPRAASGWLCDAMARNERGATAASLARNRTSPAPVPPQLWRAPCERPMRACPACAIMTASLWRFLGRSHGMAAR